MYVCDPNGCDLDINCISGASHYDIDSGFVYQDVSDDPILVENFHEEADIYTDCW